MFLNPLGLLGILGGIVSAATKPHAPAADGPQFADKLDDARSADVASNLPVHVDASLGLNLTGDQVERLSIAADKAEAAGLRRALVHLDGKAVVLDVKSRTVLRAADREAPLPADVDGVVTAPALGETGQGVMRVPGGLAANTSVNALLERMEQQTSQPAIAA
ncbi:MAG: hypothetical protein KF745_02235 [Phycisphaeraceae bacterium]|nr:hypothetical protein [Phycisphaeraceae bacterium]